MPAESIKQPASRQMSLRSCCRRCLVAIAEAFVHCREWLAVHFRIRVDEKVERVACLPWGERQVAPDGELDAVLVVRAEEVFAPGRVLRRLRRVNRHPADPFGVELRPAMIAADLAGAAVGGQREAYGEARG